MLALTLAGCAAVTPDIDATPVLVAANALCFHLPVMAPRRHGNGADLPGSEDKVPVAELARLNPLQGNGAAALVA
ncbi:MAG: hypothetical protein OXG54_01990, partial [Gammaproteobacteria bacterium]|nr:hypothetical protein [Gammaproteobacteria bacterium]